MSSGRSIFLKSISCKGIKSPIPLTAPSLYATVSLSASSQRHQTPVDTANGEDHEWECPMRFDLPTTAPSDGQDLCLEFELTAQVPVLGNRIVGKARVPVSDLINGRSSGHVGYQVLWPDGKPNGTIQLWYRMEGSELPGYSSLEPSAPPSADFSYYPSVEPGPVYPASVPAGTVPFSSQLVNSGPAFYPPLPGLAAYNSEPVNPGSVEPGRVYGTPAGTEYMPYPPSQSSGLYPPPPNSGFGSLVPSYPPPRTHDPLMDQVVSTSTYYPPPGTHYPPPDHIKSGPTYYPPPETRYPPSMGSDCRDCECREAQEPVVAYPVGNRYCPPPPRYPYY